ncbi:alpha-amylase family glycosyl hydrolase [Echinicola jeungdonensis]|uniref:Alpha-amylase n=1 Tax=Echinicola jeungdonensis TaxID=709343 RepID=A0ABV5J961_9BACT|nr:alpha-amylase family glycosyl hydrolase [Echinicola jeungdonensis]MDN3670529.1 alpha-amylase family glycosyl hydrolase [Echinicola jeungdonensis]
MSSAYTFIKDLDLSPKPGKIYWKNGHREWREEFIYFLMVDRFHDDLPRKPIGPGKVINEGLDNEALKKSCGGTLKGITANLDYIRDLGCTSIWLSPVFENNPQSYHGYAIQDYTRVDPRFGTKEDLTKLVDKAHSMNMRVFLDVVLHHSGDNWAYPFDKEYFYHKGKSFPFGQWRYHDKPSPNELRNPDLYFRKGQIRNFDSYPETQEGDFFGLKTFKNDNSPEAHFVQDILTKIHCYWIKETDVDGFRLDTVKHMGEKAISIFCSHIREYAYRLGKHSFFLFGELIGPDKLYNRYIGPKTSSFKDDTALYYGLNSVLDFPLFHILSQVILGKITPKRLIERYESLRKNALTRGEYGEFLVTFIDNHDQVGQFFKSRFGYEASPSQIIAGMGFLLCALGAPCIYYGTEQGFKGHGSGDWNIREPMFDLTDPEHNALDKNNPIYQGIASLAKIRNENAVLKFGRMYMRKYSKDGINFQLPLHINCLLAFSRVLYDEEMVIAYNTSTNLEIEGYITVQREINPEGSVFRFVFGGKGKIHVLKDEKDSRHFLKLRLAPTQFVILSNQPVN